MILQFLKSYGEIGALGIFVGMMAWYLYHTVKVQSEIQKKRETRDEKREDKIINMVDTSLKSIEVTTTKNKMLNKQIVVTQERLASSMGDIERAVRNTLEASNGKNPAIKKILERLDKVEKNP
ncbi:hypothetical protein KAU34_10495 [candidate division WOR-3 bacterium]|nr:hypothetical protein [candidate division WOR-3 bacterium]